MSYKPRKVTPEEAKWKAEAWSEETNWPGASLLAAQAFARRAARAEWENANMRELLTFFSAHRGAIGNMAKRLLEEIDR